jgi:hypothetical protein
MILRRVIREETGLTAVTPPTKWRGGELVLAAPRFGPPGEDLADRIVLPTRS